MPVKAGLKDRSLHLLKQRGLGWWNALYRLGPRGEHAESDLFHTGCTTPLLNISTTKHSIRCMWTDSIPILLLLLLLTSEPLTCRSDLESYPRLPRRSSCHIQETKKYCHIPLGCGTESRRWTLTDQYLREVSELECRDTSFRYQSPPTAMIARVYRRTGAPRQQCRCPPCEHMPYYDLALLH